MKYIICFGTAWIITNGWAYIALGLGLLLKIKAITVIASGYLSLLWLPFTPEKLITAAIGYKLLKKFYPSKGQEINIPKFFLNKQMKIKTKLQDS